MHRAYLEVDELKRPIELASNSGVTDKEAQDALKWYFELSNTVYTWDVSEVGGAVLISLMYVTYRLISKLRGNERNVSLNTYGIMLAMLEFVNYSVTFTDFATLFLVYDKSTKWFNNHQTLYRWI